MKGVGAPTTFLPVFTKLVWLAVRTVGAPTKIRTPVSFNLRQVAVIVGLVLGRKQTVGLKARLDAIISS